MSDVINYGAFVPIKGYEGMYEISTRGYVYSNSRKKMMKHNFHSIMLYNGFKNVRESIGTLYIKTFCDIPIRQLLYKDKKHKFSKFQYLLCKCEIRNDKEIIYNQTYKDTLLDGREPEWIYHI